jgi:pimeloyl-ACP methyl ester carboxylesterase
MSDTEHRSNRSGLVKVRDGLRLYVSHWPAPGSSARPVLCLPGLTRNGRDFAQVASALSRGDGARDVFTLDSRGRGGSDWDPNWKNYAILTETHDVIDVMTALGLADAAILGTSRGGIIAMILAAIQPGAVGTVILNDIGPVIERAGLVRIAGYVGRMPLPLSWADAGQMIADVSSKSFPAVAPDQWAQVARAWFNEKDGRPALGYDPAIGRSLSSTDAMPPTLWAQFGALKAAPMLAIRGETSDLLGAETVREMQVRHPNCARLEVKGQGHAPLLMDQPTIAVIRDFLKSVDQGTSVAGRVY